MPWKFRLDTENVFLISGILIVLLGWISDFIGLIVLKEAPSSGGHSAGSLINRVFFTLFGLFFAAGGAVYENHIRFLNDAVYSKRYLIQALFIIDGALHLFAFNDHLNASLVEAAFFAVIGPIQIACGVLITRLPARDDPYLLAWPVFLIVLALISLIVPIWPLSAVENIYDLWVVSKIAEVATVLMLISLMRDDHTLNWASIKRAALAVAGR
ncbi:MAG TPA: hypothetical protein VEY12_09475 [Thermoplasmata archaeon]|nr:hypothetical protein [Thermoplasmata archaeon]